MLKKMDQQLKSMPTDHTVKITNAMFCSATVPQWHKNTNRRCSFLYGVSPNPPSNHNFVYRLRHASDFWFCVGYGILVIFREDT